MNTGNWQKIKDVFSDLIELPEDERAACLDRCDVTLRDDVQSLMKAHKDAGDFINEPALVDIGLATENQPDPYLGERIDSYKILKEIGQGGMGTVYLASRADESFDKQVAIKLIKRGMDTNAVLKRFMMERQILAQLENPNIASLLDGGSTADGLPYLVMEYIEGEPITKFCDSHQFSIQERLELFQKACSAVSYAHQNLVVHRDLKPSNILVTQDGTPKLLDFGIAKLLHPDWSLDTNEATATMFRAMTPEYASPEQLRGSPITTASDVYSLGIVLYELLTGERPFKMESRPPEEVARLVLTQEPVKPSSVVGSRSKVQNSNSESEASVHEGAQTTDGIKSPKLTTHTLKSLRGDLDNIILKALRKEPERRYASVQEFSEDIRRHLEGLPVTATPDTFSYRARKFTQRHKAVVIAAAIVVITLLTATVITAWQASVARTERAKAERRFGDVRKLANAVLFKYHDAIERLPGSTPVRTMLVQDALEYLDNLSRESGNDNGLQREIASAYHKVGDVQGNPTTGNLGNLAGALNSYQKALDLREKLAGAYPERKEDRRNLAATYAAIADVFFGMLEFERTLENYRKAVTLNEALVGSDPNDVETQRNLWLCYRKLGRATAAHGDMKTALVLYRKAREINERLTAIDGTSRQARSDLAATETSIGEVTAELGDMNGAVESFRRALRIDQELSNADTADSNSKLAMATDFLNIGEASYYLGDSKSALDNTRKAVGIFESIVSADPKNAQAKFEVARGYKRIGEMFTNQGREFEAVIAYRKAIRFFDELIETDAVNSKVKGGVALALSKLGMLLAKEGDFSGALEAGQRGLAIAEQLQAAVPSSAEVSAVVAVAYSALGNTHATFADDSRRSVATRLVEWREARMWFQKSIDIWTRLKAEGKFTSVTYGGPEQIQQAIAKCDAAIALLSGK